MAWNEYTATANRTGGTIAMIRARVERLLRGAGRFFRSPEMFYRIGAKLLVRMLYRCRFVGFENIPETGPAILAANHVSYMDGLIIHAASPRPVHFVIDEAIYSVPFVKYWLDYAGAIPISPNKQSVKRAIEMVGDALRAGHLVCIFPEGTMTYTGNMTRFRFGVEWMLKEFPVPVIPIALKGLWGSIFSRKYLRAKWRFLPRGFRRKVTAVCGAPIPPERLTVAYLQRMIMALKNSA